MTTPNLNAVINTLKTVFPNGEHLGKIKAQRKLNTAAEYRPQLTADLERLYNSLDDHDKGVLQDRLDDMWIIYCIARYTDKGACSGQQRGL